MAEKTQKIRDGAVISQRKCKIFSNNSILWSSREIQATKLTKAETLITYSAAVYLEPETTSLGGKLETQCLSFSGTAERGRWKDAEHGRNVLEWAVKCASGECWEI